MLQIITHIHHLKKCGKNTARTEENGVGTMSLSMAVIEFISPVEINKLGQHIRLLLEYTGEEYKEKRYQVGPPPDFDRSQWLDEKFTLGLNFPNLPYYIDGDIKITQSNAIMRYLGRKHGMAGSTEQEMIAVDVLENLAYEMRIDWAMLVYFHYDEKKQEYIDKLPDKMKALSDYLGNQSWFLGEKITYPDFFFYEILDIHLLFQSTCLDSFQNLKDFHARFEALPSIKKYIASPKFIQWPINGPTAKFSGS